MATSQEGLSSVKLVSLISHDDDQLLREAFSGTEYFLRSAVSM
jgi:hypothetical protein